jgi:hypothetical protein
MPRRTCTILSPVLLGACNPPLCIEPLYLDQTYLDWKLSLEEPLNADFELPPFLYVTTTNPDSGFSVRDRALLETQGGDDWGFDYDYDFFAAPPIACDPELGRRPYPAQVYFELGTVDELPVDEVGFPPIEFELPRDRKGKVQFPLWNDMHLQGFLEGNSYNESNLPVNTETW